ncbi:hypothetical protein ACFQJC_15075 [Haloferax namakaokahaiae]|uniref:Uncharacterized protein n=1 Tax=Haloferax namakaokahaiae TaxID=1748331 RepID=A0ABD5ZIH5_9EURY
MAHDRIHAKRPTHDIDRWTEGTIETTEARDGHWVIHARNDDGETVELVVTFAIRDLFCSRLDFEDSPVGARFWYRKKSH